MTSRRHTLPVEPAPSLYVVSHVGDRYCGCGPCDPDRSNEEPRPVLLFGKDMLDPGTNLRLFGIAPGDRLRHRFALGLLGVNAAGLSSICEARFAGLRGSVSPFAARSIQRIAVEAAKPNRWANLRTEIPPFEA